VTEPVESDAAAYFLSQSGGIEGVVSHDFHFWNETNDVIAEFTRALGGGARFEQVSITPPSEVCVRTIFDGEASDKATLDIDGGRGLDAVVEYINAAMDANQRTRRICALETDEFDWRVFVACDPDVMRVLAEAGQTRKLYL